jgi:hypothetical protein
MLNVVFYFGCAGIHLIAANECAFLKPEMSVTNQMGLYFKGLVDNLVLLGIFVSPRLSIWSSVGK